MNLKFAETIFAVWLVAVWFGILAAPGFAAQDDSRLDPLFDKLVAVENPREARRITLRIWQIWTESGSPTVDLLMEKALGQMRDGKTHGAIETLDLVVALAPDFAEGWNKRATAHFYAGNLNESIADIQHTLALEPRHFGALSGLGMVNLALHDSAKALKAFREALKLHPFLPGVSDQVKALSKKLRGRRL